MCERRGVTALALALLALAPLRAAAQVPTAQELERELARLEPLYLAAEREADRGEAALASAREGTVEQVTTRVGPLRIVTSDAQVDLARRLFREEWARYDAITRGRTEPLDQTTFVFHVGSTRQFVTRG